MRCATHYPIRFHCALFQGVAMKTVFCQYCDSVLIPIAEQSYYAPFIHLRFCSHYHYVLWKRDILERDEEITDDLPLIERR